MKNYFQRQDIIDIQQIIQIGENWQKTSAPRWETDPQGINEGCSERQCTSVHWIYARSALQRTMSFTGLRW